MASNQLFIIPDIFFAFSQLTLLWLGSYGYLRFEGKRKIPLGRQGKKFAQLAVSV